MGIILGSISNRKYVQLVTSGTFTVRNCQEMIL